MMSLIRCLDFKYLLMPFIFRLIIIIFICCSNVFLYHIRVCRSLKIFNKESDLIKCYETRRNFHSHINMAASPSYPCKDRHRTCNPYSQRRIFQASLYTTPTMNDTLHDLKINIFLP